MFRSPEIIHENSLLQLLAEVFLPFMGLFFDFVISIPTFTKFTKYSTIGNPKFGHLKTIKIFKKNAESKYVDTVNLRNVENELE